MHTRTRGFTLVELLIVIAIIGLLTTVAMASFGIVQRKGRDARRMEDVQAIQQALASFVAANGGVFPISTTPVTITGTDAFSAMLVTAEAMSVVPRDPGYPAYMYTYQSNAAGSTYTLSFCLETDSIKNYVQGCGNAVSP